LEILNLFWHTWYQKKNMSSICWLTMVVQRLWAFAILFPISTWSVSVKLYDCNAAAQRTGDASSLFGQDYQFFTSDVRLDWFGSREYCKNPSEFSQGGREFAQDDPAVNMRPDLAVLTNPANYEKVLTFVTNQRAEYFVGLRQGNATSCSSPAQSNIFEPSFNWTWVDGTPLIRSSNDHDLVYFGQSQPDGGNSVSREDYGSFFGVGAEYFLNDLVCSSMILAICAIPGM
jgi:hypothetical protein